MPRRNLYKRLKRLFSTNVIVRNVGGSKLRVADTSRMQAFTSRTLYDRYNRIHYQHFGPATANRTEHGLAYQGARLQLFRDYDIMDSDAIISCLDGETKIATLQGMKSIKALVDDYPNGESFQVWSWDKDEGRYIIGNAHHPRKTGTKEVITLVLDNGEELRCTEDHRILLIDGTYKEAGLLQLGESVMPFTHICANCKIIDVIHTGDVVDVYDLTVDVHANFCLANGMIVSNSALDIYSDECVGADTKIPLLNGNTPTIKDLYEQKATNFWVYSKDSDGQFIPAQCERVAHNGKKLVFKITFDDSTVIEATRNHLWRTPDGKLCATEALKIGDSVDASRIKSDLVTHHASFDKRSNDLICLEAAVNNHKIVSVEPLGKRDVYDLVNVGSTHIYAVEANDGSKIYCHNCTVKSESGESLVIESPDEQVREILHNLFYDILNIEFNLWPWIRNLPVKYDTPVPLLSGETIPIQEVSRRIKDGQQVWVYSVQDKTHEIVPGKVTWCDKTYTTDKIVRVVFDDDSFVETSPEHLFILRDGTERRADELKVSDSLMPWLQSKKKDYEAVKEVHFLDDTCDVYCMTVVGEHDEQDRHNFAVCGRDRHGVVSKNSGVFVKNCKYGDLFLFLEITEKYGIVNILPLSVYDTIRVEGENPANPYEVYFQTLGVQTPRDRFENYEIAHFRLLADSNFLPYGKAMIEGGRRSWKQLQLMEDAMLVHRLVRAPDRRIFKVDIGNLPTTEVDTFMERLITKVQKTPLVDPITGDYNLKFNLMNVIEDFYLPIRGGDSGTTIENLSGLTFNATEDVEYLRNKMIGALKVPRPFLGYEEQICISPDTKIELLNGQSKSVKELINDHEQGIQNYVLSIDEDTQNVVSGKINWVGYTRKDAQVVKVHLDNGKSIVCTPDHKFMLHDGSWIEAQQLNKNDSLMPLYLATTENKQERRSVKLVESLPEVMDTCDLRVDNYHNFGTSAGVFIHNSGKATLAAEDVRFARTIERIQRIVLSELTKIAIVHLYSQGFTDEMLVNFSLDLTNPSTIYEQEKIQLWSERIRLGSEMAATNMISSDWIYDKVFGMSEDEVTEHRMGVVKDKKRMFRLGAIEGGADPESPEGVGGEEGEGIGGEAPAPGGHKHGGAKAAPGKVDLSGLPTEDLQTDAIIGRPREIAKLGSDKHYLGRDPLGNKENEKALHRDPEGDDQDREVFPARLKKKHESLELRGFVKSLAKKFGRINGENNGEKKLSYLTEEALQDTTIE